MKKNIGKKIFGLLAIVFSAVLCMGAVVALSRGEKPNDFSILWGQDYIFEDTNGLVFSPYQELRVNQFDGAEEEVTVSIFAIENKEQDVEFSTSEKSYTWNNDMNSRDVTEAFDLTITPGNVTKIESGATFEGVLEFYLGNVEFSNFEPGGDFFLMVISVEDGGEISLGFSL